MKQVLIWDFNGTILDDLKVCLQAINQMLAARSLPVLSTADYLEHFDFPVQDYYRKVGFDFDREPFTALAAEYMALYQPASFQCRLRRVARTTLAALRDRGIRQVLLSATRQDFLEEQLSHFRLGGYFSDILGLSDILGRSKLDMAVTWFSDQGIDPQDTLLIGDTQHDYIVAQALHCPCVLVAGGHNSKARLIKSGASVLENLAELPAFIQGDGLTRQNLPGSARSRADF
jgi:phosphoglycolate phosphatase